MIHKHSNNATINMVNYLANSSSNLSGSTFSFYSFCEVTGSNPYWAWQLGDEHYCAITLSNSSIDRCISDQEDVEKAQIVAGQLYPAYLKGSDNTSYIKRFETSKQMLEWARTVPNIDIDNDPTLLYYNS